MLWLTKFKFTKNWPSVNFELPIPGVKRMESVPDWRLTIKSVHVRDMRFKSFFSDACIILCTSVLKTRVSVRVKRNNVLRYSARVPAACVERNEMQSDTPEFPTKR